MSISKLILICLIVFNIVWNIFLNVNPDKATLWNYLFNFTYALIFIFGAGVAYKKSLYILGTGVLSYALGLCIWTFYNVFLKTPVPYPGLSDVAFLCFTPLTGLGFILLLRRLGFHFSASIIIQSIILCGVLFYIIYSFLNKSSLGDEVPFLHRVLNISYPFSDAVLIAIAIGALKTEKGLLNPHILLFVFAFLTFAAADTIFSFRVTNEIYWNGDVADTLYLIAASLFAWAIIFVDERDYLKSSVRKS